MNILEYLRMVAYGIVIWSAILAYRFKKYSPVLLIGDMFFSAFAIFALIHIVIFNGDRMFSNNLFITSGLIIWSSFHLYNLIRK